MHELSQVPRADHTARAKYEKPISARLDLKVVGTPTEVQQFTVSKELVLFGVAQHRRNSFPNSGSISLSMAFLTTVRRHRSMMFFARIWKTGSRLKDDWNAAKVVTVAPSPNGL